jgi:preprotein translocase subunit Sss1
MESFLNVLLLTLALAGALVMLIGIVGFIAYAIEFLKD